MLVPMLAESYKVEYVRSLCCIPSCSATNLDLSQMLSENLVCLNNFTVTHLMFFCFNRLVPAFWVRVWIVGPGVVSKWSSKLQVCEVPNKMAFITAQKWGEFSPPCLCTTRSPTSWSKTCHSKSRLPHPPQPPSPIMKTGIALFSAVLSASH